LFNQTALKARTYIPYRGGDNAPAFGALNTRLSPHLIPRSAFSSSMNGWIPAKGQYGKRPGNINFASGATGSGLACSGMQGARFANVSSVVAQTNSGRDLYWARVGDANFTKITTQMGVASKSINACQMFDPDSLATGANLLFVCNGVDIPWTWGGPALTVMTAMNAAGAQNFPNNHTNAAPITPKYCATLGQTPIMFMAGEPTEPCGVYISDAFFPRRYNRSNTLAAATPANYQPALIGFNDGIRGGDITGLLALNNSMMIYKQSAVYRLDFGVAVYGDVNYASTCVDNSVGNLSPRSIVGFPYFHCFLGIDGVYRTDGYSKSQNISANVPTFFDASLTGSTVIIDRTTAVGTRVGNTYMLFYDAGTAAGVANGYPNRGMWFNFDVLDADGLPTTGEILGMNVNGACELRGPADAGQMVWCNGGSDQVGQFGTHLYSDFAANIQTTFAGKVDYIAEFFDPGAPLCNKVVDSVWIELAIPQPSQSTQLLFQMDLTQDIANSVIATGITNPIPGTNGAKVGDMLTINSVVGAPPNGSFYQAVKISGPYPSTGRVVGVQFSENSVNGWSCLGYDVFCNAQEVTS
jgi:hypothetical protein